MKNVRKDNALDRKLRALEQQARALDSNIKSVSRTLEKSGIPLGDPAIRAALAERTRETMTRHNPNYAASIGTGTATSVAVTVQQPQPAGEADVNLFSVAPVQPEAPNLASSLSETAAPAARVRRVVEPQRADRMRNYLSNGSFGGNVPLGREREAQRFRAILALIAVITFGYIIYRALFR